VDNLTHTLVALTLANAGFRRFGRGATATLVLASNIPDLEFVTRLADNGRLAYLAAHRGPTHGPLGLALGASMAAIVWLAGRRPRSTERAASFPALVAIGMAGVVGHVLLDLGTSYGTRVLSPLSAVWYGVDWLPVLDVWLWALLGCGLAAAWLRPAQRRAAALACLALAVGYVGLRATTHDAALGRALEIQALAGVEPDATGSRTLFAYLNSSQRSALPAALPAGSSPFAWRLITRAPSGFEVRDVNLLSRGEKQRSAILRFPDGRSPLIARASEAPTARVFLDFSRFTSVEVRRHRNGDATVHWYDMRFGRPAEGIDERSYTSPFGAWVRLAPDGRILRYGLGPG
jgi:membrane-bound metal-dependent hydrolase YbcI (DUF457 family)